MTNALGANWYLGILPEMILAVAGMVLILLEAAAPRLRATFAPLTIVFLLLTAWSEFLVPQGTYFSNSYEISTLTILFDLIFLLATLLAVMFARDYLRREGVEAGEFYALLLWGTFGMMMMAKGLDLLIVILGLEILSVCIFVLVGFHRKIAVSNESSLKYFLMGAFATGFILYGTALFYGASGSTRMPEIARALNAAGPTPLMTIAFVMFISGVGFKLALAPFHGWAPDVYQGAPTPVAAWLSVAPKAATLIALIRVFQALGPILDERHWSGIVMLLAILSMILGNFVATAQRDLKRMLAYSGIAQVGYMMIAMFTLEHPQAVAAITIYALTYVLMNIGAFGVVSLLRKNQNDSQTLDDIAGLGFRRPFIGIALAIFMFSLAGIPPTGGFISKFYIFKVAVEAGQIKLAIIGILTSIVSVYYYLRVVYYLYMKESSETVPTPNAGILSSAALALSVIGLLLIGLYPTPLFQTAAAASLLLSTP